MATAAMAGVATAGVGLAAGLGVAVGQAATFQQSIADVASLLGGDMAANTSALSDLALSLGNDLTLSGVGATDAAAAMKELAAAGFTVKEMSDGVTLGVLRLASATGTDVARAAEIAGDTFNTFRKSMGLTAKDMPMIADLFTGVANASSVGLEDIGNAFKMIGPVAAGVGIDMNEVAVAIAALGNQGIKGSEAGTALRGVLASLADPSKESANLIKQLGLNFRDSEGQLKNFGGIADELNAKLGGLTQAQKEQAIVQLFGRENLAAVMALMSEGSKGLDEYGKAITDQGNAAAIGAARNNTLKGAFETLKGAAETAVIALGTGMLPALQGFAQRMAGAVAAMLPFITMLGQKLGAALTVAIGLFQRFASYVGSAISAVVDAFGKMKSGQVTLAQFIGGIKNLIGTIAKDLFGGAGDLGAGGFISGVIGVIKKAFPVVVNELAILGRAFGDWVTTTAIPWLLPRLAAWLSALGGWITGTALPWIGNALVAVGQAFGNWVSTTAVPFLQANLPVWLSALGTWLSGTALPAVGGFLGMIAQKFGTWVSETAIPYLQANLPVWLAALGTWITGTALPAIGSFLAMVGEKFGTWISETAIPYLQTNLPIWLAALGDWITGTALPAVGGFLVTIGQAMGDWITNTAVPWLQQKLPEWGAALSNWILNDGLPQAVTALASLGEKFGDWITGTAIPAVQAKLPQWSSAVADFIQNTAIPAITAKATELGEQLLQKVLDAIKDAPKKVGDIFDKVKTALTSPLADAARDAQTKMANFVGEITRALASLAVTAAAGAIKIGLAIVTGILGALAGLAGKLYTAGVNAVQGLINGMGSLLQKVKDKAGEIAKAAADAITGLWKEHSPSRLTHEFGANFVQGLINGMDEKQQEAAKKAADVASAVAKAVTDTLGAMKALANFDFANDSPTGSDMGWFAFLTESLIATLAESASHFKEETLKSVSAFADTVGKVGSSIKNAVEGLLAIGKADWANSSPDGNAMSWFVFLVTSLVENFRQAAASFDEDGLAAAATFAEAVGKVTGVIGTAVTGLTALHDFSAPAEETVSRFMASLSDLMEKFGTWAGEFEADSLAASSVFAEAAGKVAGSLSNGVTGLAALRDFAAPAEAGVSAFLAALSDLMEKFGTWASNFEADALEHTQLFADVAGKALAAAKTGVDLFKSFDKLAVPSREAIDQLVIAIEYVVHQFGYMAERMESEGLKQLSAFADAAGKSLSAVKTGTDLFKGMEKLAVPGRDAIDFLLGTIGYIITQTQAIANGIGTEGLAQAVSFANGAASFIGSLKATLEGFKALLDYKDVPAQVLREVWNGLEGALSAMGDLVARSDALKNSALDYLANMEATALAVLKAQNIGNGLGSTVPALVTAPSGIGFGGGDSSRAGGTSNTYQVTFAGPTYGVRDMVDVVVGAMETATRTGRA